jgi:hypothetical protein
MTCADSGTLVPTPEDDANTDPPPEPSAPALTQLRCLDLLIEDLRDQPANKFIQDIQVESEVDLETGEWLVNTKGMLSALQKSPSSLNGRLNHAH